MTRPIWNVFLRGQLPGALLGIAMLVSSMVDAHWSIKLGTFLCALYWYVFVQKIPLLRLHYAPIALGVGCVLLLQFGSLGVLAQRSVNDALLVILVGNIVFLLWNLIAVVTFANRELRDIRRQPGSSGRQ